MVIDFSNFYEVPRQLERMFEDYWSPLTISQRRLAYPPVNISEDDSSVYVQAEIPGMDMQDIDLTLSDGTLTIKGQRKTEKGDYFRQERPMGTFQRMVNLNVQINRDAVKASMKDGIVEVVLPKAEEVKPKKISIDVS